METGTSGMSETSQAERNVCQICKDAESDSDFVTRCGHFFHEKCLKDWLKTRSECPYCRTYVSGTKLHEKFLGNVRKAGFDKETSSGLASFYKRITELDQQVACYNRNRSKFSPEKTRPDIPFYGKNMIENLIKAGWNINGKEEGCWNLVRDVCEKDDLYRLNLLIDHDLNLFDDRRYCDKIMNATLKGSLIHSVVSDMKNKPARIFHDDGNTALHKACFEGNEINAEELLKSGADVNMRNRFGARPLHFACSAGSLKLVNLLLEYGAKINCFDLSGRSPLYEACTNKFKGAEIVERLLDSGADTDITDRENNTLLHVALIYQNLAVAEMFLKLEKYPIAVNAFDESPLHLAAYFAPVSVIEKLIEMGADNNAKDSEERTPLHIAVAHNDPEVVDLLLSKGAEVNVVNKKKESAILLAMKRVPCLRHVDALVKYGADMNFKDSEGRTALQLSLIKKY